MWLRTGELLPDDNQSARDLYCWFGIESLSKSDGLPIEIILGAGACSGSVLERMPVPLAQGSDAHDGHERQKRYSRRPRKHDQLASFGHFHAECDGGY